jgi:hypothetical protein
MPDSLLKIDMSGLYRWIIARKYDIYQEKFQVNMNNTVAVGQREHDLKCMRDDHQLLALKVLFTEEQVALFKKNREC